MELEVGLEPTTPALPWRCSAELSYSSLRRLASMIGASGTRRPLVALLVGTLLLSACGDGEQERTADAEGSARLVIETDDGPVEVLVEVADEPAERQRGLMGREELPEDAGMVFLHEEPTTSGFWMKDTLIPLSVAFWDEGRTIVDILDLEPCEADPCEIYTPSGAWVGAVEVNQGFFEKHGVEVGDTVRLELPEA